mgnify:CR=1 FL=1|jgi:hypothetical protein
MLKNDLNRLAERDRLQIAIDQERKALDSSTVEKLEVKLKVAITNLNDAMEQYKDLNHPRILECWLHISKLSYYLDRPKDSNNILKRGLKKVNNLPDGNLLKESYHQWQNYLNNT